jgi:hypothetical protein
MEPDSEEIRRTFEPFLRREALWREEIMAGGAMEDVAWVEN